MSQSKIKTLPSSTGGGGSAGDIFRLADEPLRWSGRNVGLCSCGSNVGRPCRELLILDTGDYLGLPPVQKSEGGDLRDAIGDLGFGP